MQAAQRTSTFMVRYECGQCPMVATVVHTIAGVRAWGDHMDTHDDPGGFSQWFWEVMSLPFD